MDRWPSSILESGGTEICGAFSFGDVTSKLFEELFEELSGQGGEPEGLLQDMRIQKWRSNVAFRKFVKLSGGRVGSLRGLLALDLVASRLAWFGSGIMALYMGSR